MLYHREVLAAGWTRAGQAGATTLTALAHRGTSLLSMMSVGFYMVYERSFTASGQYCVSIGMCVCVLGRTAGQLLNLGLGKEAEVGECIDIQDRNVKERPDAGLVGLQRVKGSSGAIEYKSVLTVTMFNGGPQATRDFAPRKIRGWWTLSDIGGRRRTSRHSTPCQAQRGLMHTDRNAQGSPTSLYPGCSPARSTSSPTRGTCLQAA